MTEENLFELALKVPASERAALLDRECGGNPELRQRVEALLAAHAEPGDFLKPAQSTVADRGGPHASSRGGSASERPGAAIAAKYKLLQQIGEGGMGSVWMADQTEPVKRRVAVKLIRADHGGSSTILARFEAERQAIALMDHPHIARLLDAGTTEAGAPFFIMELVKGVPLTKFCDTHQLTIPERLHLFQQICSAVQHAHHKGIIHRDLKPSNVLVESHDGQPVPKVIDFGLAKATSGIQLTEHTLFTGFGTVAGTPLYMAPEQAHFNAVDIDTRADVYALGVLLYELLTGTTPITRETAKKAALDEMLRLIREQEPPTPSSRLSGSDNKPSVAANRRTEPAKLGRFVKGELDWIVLKALSKERERRYETASAFAKDIERFLNHEPVQAGPPSVRYRLRKFVRRNRPQVIAASLILLALVAGIIGTTLGLVRAVKAERAATVSATAEAEQRKKAEQAETATLAAYRASTNDAIEQLIGSKPVLGPKERAYLENTLKRWQAFANRQGDDERSRAIRAEGHFRVGYLWQKLGRTEEARRAYQTARDLQKQLVAQFANVPEYQVGLANTHYNLAVLLRYLGKYPAARRECQTARDLQKQLVAQFADVPEYQAGLALTHNTLGVILRRLRKYAAARREYQTAIDLRKKLVARFPTMPEYRADLAGTHNNLGVLLKSLGKDEEAWREYQAALELQKKLTKQFPAVPLYKQDLARTHSNRGSLLKGLDKWEQAQGEYQAALDIRKKLVAQFPNVIAYQRELANTHNKLGNLLAVLKKGEEARREYQAALDLREKLAEWFPTVPGYQADLASTHNNLGVLLKSLGKGEEARREYRAALELQKKLAEKFHDAPLYQLDLGASYCNYGNLIRDEGEPAESLQWYDRAIQTLKPLHDKEPRDVTARRSLRNSHSGRARAYALLKQHAKTIQDLDQAIALSPPGERPRYRVRRAISQLQSGRVAEAVAAVAELTKDPNWHAPQWYFFGCVYAAASGKITDKKQQYADRAIELLNKAVQAGWTDAAQMAKNKDLDPLREREDFKKLLAELEK